MTAVFRRFKWIIYAYLFFVSLWWIAQFFRIRLMPLFDTEPFNLGAGFYISWLASLLEDLIFFGTIGFISLVLSTKLPQDENFNIRVESIANGKKVGPIARRYLNESIKELLVYNDTFCLTIIIKNVDRVTNIAEVYAQCDNVCTNMCKDVAYPLNTAAKVTPTLDLNGDYGNVSLLKIYELGNSANCKPIIEGEVKKLASTGFEEKLEFEVPPNGAAVWKFCYTIWQRIAGNRANGDDWYFFQIEGFTESISIKLVNKTNIDVKYDFEYIDREGGNVLKVNSANLIRAMLDNSPTEISLLQHTHSLDKDNFRLFFHY